MKVLLIQPAATDRGFIHLGLGFIAASIEECGHTVRIIDLGIEGESKKSVIRLIKETAPDLVGITTLTPTYPGALRVAAMVKELYPKCSVILGGTHPNILTDEVLKEPVVDIVVRGEGEITMAELVDAIEKGSGLSDVKGVSYKKNNEIVHNAPRPLIDDLDTLPSPPWHLFPLEKYTGNLNGRKAVGISAARGCPFSCVFCYRGPAAGKTIRFWSPERVIKEIKKVKETYGINDIHFWNDVFTYDKKWVSSLCDLLIEQNIYIKWDCQTRADLINEEVLRKMKKSGCTAVMLGVESGSNEVLQQMEKGLTKERIYDAFKLLHEIGFETTATFTLGLPWDTRETIQETIDFAKEINPNFAMFYVAIPFPGSPLWWMSRERGIQISRNWANYRILPFEVDVKHMVPLFDTSKLSKHELSSFLKTAQIEFQFSRLRGGKERKVKGIKNIIDLFKLLYFRTKSVRKLIGFSIRITSDMMLFLWRRVLRVFGA